jgi:hypothetical protein
LIASVTFIENPSSPVYLAHFTAKIAHVVFFLKNFRENPASRKLVFHPKNLLHLNFGPSGYFVGFLRGLLGMFQPFGLCLRRPSERNPTAFKLDPLSSGKL